MLVHLDSSELLEQYVLIGVDFDPSLIRTVEPSAWPRHWRSDPAPAQLRSIGDDWILRGPSSCAPGSECPSPGGRHSSAESSPSGFCPGAHRPAAGLSLRSSLGNQDVTEIDWQPAIGHPTSNCAYT